MSRGAAMAITAILALSASSNAAAQELKELHVQTVLGPVEGDQLGPTLTHEHVLVDFVGAVATGPHRWNREEVVALVLPYLEAARQAGATAMVECTPAHLGRDPRVMLELAQRSGLHLIMPTGFYGARDGMFVPAALREAAPRDLADIWVAEHREGIDGTKIRPGFIKIAVHGEREAKRNDATGRLLALKPLDRRLVEAAGLAHLDTGLVIACHTSNASGLEAVAILREQGVSPQAFIWVHAQNAPLDIVLEAAQHGTWISFDNFRSDRLAGFVERLEAFRREGLLHRVLLSHDAGWYRVGEPGGSPEKFRGYTELFEHLVPALREAGFNDEDLHQLLVTNAAQAFAVRVRKAP